MTRTRAREEGRLAAIKLAGFWANAGHTVKNFFVGEPRRFVHELRAGTAWQPGGTLRETFLPRTLGGTLMTYGMPLGMSALMMRGLPAQYQGQGWGSTLGSMAGGMALAPLGFLGQTVGSMAGGLIGERAGRAYDESQRG